MYLPLNQVVNAVFARFHNPTAELQSVVMYYMLAHVPYADGLLGSVVKPFPWPQNSVCISTRAALNGALSIG
jgi:hypothetical protein